MKRIFPALSLIACLLFAGNISAQQTAEKYVIEYDYLLYLPDGYADGDESWPLVIFLHGAGETGNDLDKIKVHGIPKLAERGDKMPFIGVSPQAKQYGWDPKFVVALLEEVASKYRIDRDRLYLTGLSMGGFGTWSTAQAYPGLFAAIAPICGGGEHYRAYTLINTPIWNFHGDADGIVLIERSNTIVDAVREFNPGIKYTIYPGVDHDSWTQTYDNPELWEWLLAQRKFRYQEVELTPQQFSDYTGVYGYPYEGMEDEEILFRQEGNAIVFGSSDDQTRKVIPAGNDIFFTNPEAFEYMKFERDPQGNITAAMFYMQMGWQRMERKRE